MCFSELISR